MSSTVSTPDTLCPQGTPHEFFPEASILASEEHRKPLLFQPSAPWLAPLAGYSDLSFRLLCREQGAAVACTEMVSAKGLVYKSPGTNNLLATTPHDAPLVVQLFGRDTDIMVQAMEQLMGQGFRYFDLNMGCSVPKVNKTGCGSAMLRDIPNALDVAKVMIATAGQGNVGFKFRLGWEAGQEVYLELGKALEQVGAAWLTLHPRYARQGFSGTANWSALKQLVDAVQIPVIASGDLMSAADGVRCIEETGVATVMYARGAMNDPAIFAGHASLMSGGPDLGYEPRRIHALISRHAVLAKQYAPGRSGLLKMRTFVPRYVRHMSGARVLRQHLASCFEWDMLDDVLALFFERNVEGHKDFFEDGADLPNGLPNELSGNENTQDSGIKGE